ncbi:helix-turn-helix transcriptional regulator [Curtobacterium flaccumfaciens]|uniref:helix-turn-helix transcriptional regulator n=1 Tax=Curtobacterium flaccumfaciens TaxID=2035 RepID=UPI001E37724C|nr:helix-turn-helix transcriptional regulator [Curtobacterium allii]MCE0459700.1 helix-turn-helix transcriptional regulator [Curtobacterium allii]
MASGVSPEAMSGRVAGFEDRLAALYGRARTGDGGRRVELRRAGDEVVAVTRVLCDGVRRGFLQHPTHHLLVVVVGDGDAVFADGTEVRLESDSTSPVLLQASVRYSYEVTAARLTLLQVSDALLRSRAAALGITVSDDAKFAQPASADDRRTLVRMVHDAASQLASEDADSDVASREAVHENVADVVLRTVPLVVPDPGLHGHVAVADQWIRSRLREEITTADIAAAVGVSVRTLQQAFHKNLGVTPTGHVRSQRLERVREALLAADDEATVASVARDWGFRHIGRFSGAYNEMFGELPRMTLAHARRHAASR